MGRWLAVIGSGVCLALLPASVQATSYQLSAEQGTITVTERSAAFSFNYPASARELVLVSQVAVSAGNFGDLALHAPADCALPYLMGCAPELTAGYRWSSQVVVGGPTQLPFQFDGLVPCSDYYLEASARSETGEIVRLTRNFKTAGCLPGLLIRPADQLVTKPTLSLTQMASWQRASETAGEPARRCGVDWSCLSQEVSRRQSAAYARLARPSSWRKLSGQVVASEPAHQVEHVSVAAIRRAKGSCHVLAGQRWRERGCRQSRRIWTPAKLKLRDDGTWGSWSYRLPQLRPGRYRILIRARETGNTQTTTFKQNVTINAKGQVSAFDTE